MAPGGTDQAVSGFQRNRKPLQPSVRLRGDTHLRETGLLRFDPGGFLVNPVCHRAVGVMVEGVHVRAPEIAVFHDAVPVLPHGGRALRYRIEPGRIFGAKEQGIGQIRMAVAAQHMEQVRRPHKTGLQFLPIRDHLFRQLVRCLLLILRQAEMNGKHQLGLRPVIRKGFAEGFHDIVIQRFIFAHILAQDLSGLHHQRGGMGIEGGGDKVRPGRALIASHRSVQAKPVLIMVSARP